jgi:hypothetical protein
MMSKQDYENGLKVRTEVMGESFVVLKTTLCLLQNHCKTG